MMAPVSANASSRWSREIARIEAEKLRSGVEGLTLHDQHFPPLSRGGEGSSGSSAWALEDPMPPPSTGVVRKKKTNEKISSTPSPSPRVQVRPTPSPSPRVQVRPTPSPSRLKEANKTSVAPAHGGSESLSGSFKKNYVSSTPSKEVNAKAEPIASAVEEPVTPNPAPISRYRPPSWLVNMFPDDFDEVIHMVRNGDMSKADAWIAREMKRADAYIRGDGAAIAKVESETLEDYMGKDFIYDQDSDEDSDDSDEQDEICGTFDLPSENDNGPFLCAVVCDFLCGFPSSSDRFWDKDITQQVLAACSKCYRKYSRVNNFHLEVVMKYAKDELPNGEDIELIDLRGLRSKDAQKTLWMHLFRLSRQLHSGLKYLNVVVGCTLHGIGEGKLRQTVIDVLMSCTTLKWTEVCNGAIISISLEDFFGRTASDFNFGLADEKADLDEMVALDAKRDTYLCTVICDFLCNLPVAHRHDPQIATKALTALKNCCGGERGLVLDVNTKLIDVRGMHFKDTENNLITFLDMLSSDSTVKYLLVIVCCNKHVSGKESDAGKRNSSTTVAEILMRDETIKWAYYDLGTFIRIELDGRKSYKNLRRTFG